MPADAPKLFWMERPRHAKCPCGREPLLGFGDGAGAFFCGACYDDGACDSKDVPWRKRGGIPLTPRFRTPEEREAILR